MAEKSLRTFTWGFGLRLAALIVLLCNSAAYAASRYVIGLDTQEIRCLEERVYVIDTWVKPTAKEIRRNDYVALILTDAQRPRSAKWRRGQIMVKRVVAAPGDHVSVTRHGVMFSNGPQAWSHGTGLAAAPMLGASPESFERVFTLAEDELFMMGDNPLSYDGRYYGPITDSQIVGRVLWAF